MEICAETTNVQCLMQTIVFFFFFLQSVWSLALLRVRRDDCFSDTLDVCMPSCQYAQGWVGVGRKEEGEEGDEEKWRYADGSETEEDERGYIGEEERRMMMSGREQGGIRGGGEAVVVIVDGLPRQGRMERG